MGFADGKARLSHAGAVHREIRPELHDPPCTQNRHQLVIEAARLFKVVAADGDVADHGAFSSCFAVASCSGVQAPVRLASTRIFMTICSAGALPSLVMVIAIS